MRSAVFVTFVASAPPALALPGEPAPTVQQVVDGVEGTYRNVHAIRADFTQITRSAALGGEQKQRGRVIVKRPRKMRWEFTGPTSSLFVTDGATMWVWSPDQNQVIVTTDLGAKSEGRDPVSLLNDLGSIDEQFDVKLLENDSGPERRSHVLELIPKAQNPAFTRLVVTVDRRKFLLQRLLWVDALGTEVELDFAQVRLDPDVPDSEFVFTVPAGAQVLNSGSL